MQDREEARREAQEAQLSPEQRARIYCEQRKRDLAYIQGLMEWHKASQRSYWVLGSS